MGLERPGAAEWVPSNADLTELRGAVQSCRGCELWQRATQAVFGEGPARASIMLVGEQPGDREDREGEPFVGPAGRILAEARESAGIARDEVYVTNAVKHFRFEERGKRRIHKRPDVGHIVACQPWLDAELEVVHPDVVVCLGATAARAVLGRPARIGDERGRLMPLGDRQALVTIHPSAVLRLRDTDERRAAAEGLAADLVVAASAVRQK